MALTDNNLVESPNFQVGKSIEWNVLPITNKKPGFLSTSKERRIATLSSGLFSVFSLACTYGAATRFTAKPKTVIRVTYTLAIITCSSIVTMIYLLCRKSSLDDADLCMKERIALRNRVGNCSFAELKEIDERVLSNEEKIILLDSDAKNLSYEEFVKKHGLKDVGHWNEDTKSLLRQKCLYHSQDKSTLSEIESSRSDFLSLEFSEDELENIKKSIVAREIQKLSEGKITYSQFVSCIPTQVIVEIAEDRKDKNQQFLILRGAFLQLPLKIQNEHNHLKDKETLQITPAHQKEALMTKWNGKSFNEIISDPDFDTSMEDENPLFRADEWKLKALEFIEGKCILEVAATHPNLFSMRILGAFDRLKDGVTIRGKLLERLHISKKQLIEIPKVLLEHSILEREDQYVQEQVLIFVHTHLENYVENSWAETREQVTYDYITELSLILPTLKSKITDAQNNYNKSVRIFNEEIQTLKLCLQGEVETAKSEYEKKCSKIKQELGIDGIDQVLKIRQEEIRKCESECNSLNEKLSTLHKNSEDLLVKKECLNTQLSSLAHEQNLSTSNFYLQKKLWKMHQQCSLKENNLTILKNQKVAMLQESDQEINQLKAKVTEIEKEIFVLEKKLSDEKKRQDQLLKLQNDIAHKTNEIQNLRTQNQTLLQEESEKKDKKVTGLVNAWKANKEEKRNREAIQKNDLAIQTILKEIASCNKEIQRIQKQKIDEKEPDAQIIQLSQEKIEVEKKLNLELKYKIQLEQSEEFKSLNAEIREKENELMRMKQEMNVLTTESEKRKNRFQQRDQLEVELQTLEQKHHNLLEEINSSNDGLKQLLFKIRQEKDLVSMLEMQLREAECNFEHCRGEYDRTYRSSISSLNDLYKSSTSNLNMQLQEAKTAMINKLAAEILNNASFG